MNALPALSVLLLLISLVLNVFSLMGKLNAAVPLLFVIVVEMLQHIPK